MKKKGVNAESGTGDGALRDIAEYNRRVVEAWAGRSGVPGAEVFAAGPCSAEVGVSAKGPGLCIKRSVFGLYFDKASAARPRSPRAFKICPRMFDAFGREDEHVIASAKLMVFFADHMEEIEKDLVSAPKAKRLYGAWRRARLAMFGRPGRAKTQGREGA